MIVERPDLSARTTLSKSAYNTFDICQTQAWFDMHERRPLIVTEKISFGSALDRAVETIIGARRDGMDLDTERMFETAFSAAATAIARDDVAIDFRELERATRGFWTDVMPHHDWSQAQLQLALNAEIEGLGVVDGHPDILLPGEVWDVKASGNPKDIPSVELGLYAILAETALGRPITRVGYFTWYRRGKKWLTQDMATSDELRRWTWQRMDRLVIARALDELANTGAERPTNWAFGGGPKAAWACENCAYNPRFGGPCQIAWMGDDDD